MSFAQEWAQAQQAANGTGLRAGREDDAGPGERAASAADATQQGGAAGAGAAEPQHGGADSGASGPRNSVLQHGGTGARTSAGERGAASAGHPELRSREDAWTDAAKALSRQRARISTALDRFATHQHGLSGGTGTAATASAAAQRALARSWNRYLKAVAERCHTLESRLRRAGHLHHGNDTTTSTLFTDLTQRYQDTPQLGGVQGRSNAQHPRGNR